MDIRYVNTCRCNLFKQSCPWCKTNWWAAGLRWRMPFRVHSSSTLEWCSLLTPTLHQLPTTSWTWTISAQTLEKFPPTALSPAFIIWCSRYKMKKMRMRAMIQPLHLPITFFIEILCHLMFTVDVVISIGGLKFWCQKFIEKPNILWIFARFLNRNSVNNKRQTPCAMPSPVGWGRLGAYFAQPYPCIITKWLTNGWLSSDKGSNDGWRAILTSLIMVEVELGACSMC